MRVLLPLAAAVASVALASPAAAQWYPAPQYGPAYGYSAYGYQAGYAHARSLQARVNGLQRVIANLDNRDIITEREARNLRGQSRDLERQLRRAAYNGLTQREAYALERRLQALEWRIQRDAHDGRRWAYRR
jgi:hypothetical protein